MGGKRGEARLGRCARWFRDFSCERRGFSRGVHQTVIAREWRYRPRRGTLEWLEPHRTATACNKTRELECDKPSKLF